MMIRTLIIKTSKQFLLLVLLLLLFALTNKIVFADCNAPGPQDDFCSYCYCDANGNQWGCWHSCCPIAGYNLCGISDCGYCSEGPTPTPGVCTGINYIFTPNNPDPNTAVYVDIQRDANSKNCNGNWNNVGVEVDGTAYPPYWAALCYHDGTTNCSQGYHANQNGNNYINSGNPGTHTVVLTLNNGACQCNGGSFTTIGTITNTPTPTIAPTLTPTLTPTSTPTMTPIPTPTPNPTGDIWWQTELGDVWADNGSLQSNISGKCNPSSQVCDISRAKDSGLSSPNDRINGVLVAAAGQISPGDNHLAGYGERFDWFAESNNGPYFLNDENGDSWPGYDYWQEKLANLTPTDYDDFSNTIDLGAISVPGLYFFTDEGHDNPLVLTIKGSVEAGEQVIILNKNNTVVFDTYPVIVEEGGFLMVVAYNDIKIENCDPDHENRIDGILVSDSVITLGGGPDCSQKLQVNGSVLGLGGVALNRSNLAKDPDNAEPYISVYYRPDMIYSAPEEIKTGTVRWQEVNPQFTY